MWHFIKENYRWIGGAFLLTYFSSFGQTFFIAGSVSEWQAKFDLSHGEFSQLFMIATLGSALTLPFIGRFIDVMPEHRLILITIPILALGTILASIAPSIVILTFSLYLLRLFGQGMMTHIAFTSIGRWFAAQRGRAVSLVMMGHHVGGFTLPQIYTFIALGVSWQAAWMAAAVVLLLLALPLIVWAFRIPRHPKGKSPASPNDMPSWTRNQVVADPIFWMLLIGVLAPPLIGTIIFFHQDYLAETRNWPPQLFPNGFSLMAIATVTVAFINGQMIDKFGARSILPTFLIPLAAACFIIATMESELSLYVFMVFIGVSFGISATLTGALWPEIYGTEHLGAIRSTIMPFTVISTAIGPWVTGLFIDRGVDLGTQMFVLGGYCLLAVVLMLASSNVLKRRFTIDKRGTVTSVV